MAHIDESDDMPRRYEILDARNYQFTAFNRTIL